MIEIKEYIILISKYDELMISEEIMKALGLDAPIEYGLINFEETKEFWIKIINDTTYSDKFRKYIQCRLENEKNTTTLIYNNGKLIYEPCTLPAPDMPIVEL